MAHDPRDLSTSEKRFGWHTSERGRDRANALRTIEGLNQQDAMVRLLAQQTDLIAQQTDMLRYLVDVVHRLSVDVGRVAAGAPPAPPAGPPQT